MSNYLKGRGFSDEIIKTFGLEDIVDEGYVKIPYFNIDGKYLYKRKNHYDNQYAQDMKYESPQQDGLPDGHSWFYGLWMLKGKNIKHVIFHLLCTTSSQFFSPTMYH